MGRLDSIMIKRLTKYIAAPALFVFLMSALFSLYAEFWRLALLIKCDDLAATVESVLGQTLLPTQLVIVDQSSDAE